MCDVLVGVIDFSTMKTAVVDGDCYGKYMRGDAEAKKQIEEALR